MEVIVKIGTTNTWGETKTKTDKDKKGENRSKTVKFSNLLQRHLATIF